MTGTEPVHISLVSCLGTTLSFDDAVFQLSRQPDGIRIAVDDANFSIVRRVPQRVPCEGELLDALIPQESRVGAVDYSRYFIIDWDDEASLPRVTFTAPPRAVERRYARGQSIELGLEDVNRYRVRYRDGVEADFERVDPQRFEFQFSTGFYGSFWKDPDGSYTLRFRGDRMEPTEDAQRSQSKFIVSRSKYSGNLLLILQDDAVVTVS